MESVGTSTADKSQTRLEWLVVKPTLIDNSAELGRYKKSFLQRLLFLLRSLQYILEERVFPFLTAHDSQCGQTSENESDAPIMTRSQRDTS